MKSQINNEATVGEINKILATIEAPFTARVGKRAIKWFRDYAFGDAAYSTSIGDVRTSVACIGDYNSDRLDQIISKAHDATFSAADAV